MENKCSDAELFSFCRVLPSCFLLPSVCSALILFTLHSFRSLLCFLLRIPSALLLHSFKHFVCSSFLPSFLQTFIPLSALPALLFLLSALLRLLSASARWGGAYPFAEKPKYHFLPPKIPAIFSKVSPYQCTHLTPYILRTVSHLASYHSEGITFSAIHLER